MNHQPAKLDSAANSPGLGPVTRATAQEHARQLAMMAGRTSWQIPRVDYEQAKRELTGESDHDLQDARLDAIPESGRWDPVPGSKGHQIPDSISPSEDNEGRSVTEQLVEDGVWQAAHEKNTTHKLKRYLSPPKKD